MNEKQLDRMSKLVGLKVEMAKMGGVKPFDRIAGFIDQDLSDLVDEIDPPKAQPKPALTVGEDSSVRMPPPNPPEPRHPTRSPADETEIRR